MKDWTSIFIGGAVLLLIWKALELFADRTKKIDQTQLLDAINAANKAAADKATADAKVASDKAAADAAAAAKAAVDKAVADAKAGK